MRLAVAAAAVLFVREPHYLGRPLSPTTAPLPALGYPVLALTFVRWIWTLLKPSTRATQ
jgi:hypothetical protein